MIFMGEIAAGKHACPLKYVSPFLEKYLSKGLVTGPIDANQLIFPYKWEDHLVESVYRAFYAWEQECLDVTYRVQGLMRGSVESEYIRKGYREFLGKLRSLDIDVLRYLVRYAKQKENPLRANLGRFHAQRETILSHGKKQGLLQADIA